MTRRHTVEEAGIGLVLAAILVGPAVGAGGLAGSAGAEVYGHAWVQWWAGSAWPAWPTGTALAEGAETWAVIDPLPTWLVAAAGQVVGPTAAWNLWAAAGVLLAAVGGGAFARALGGSGIVGAVGVATMPIFLGSLTSGLTEDFGLGLVALAFAALLRGRVLTGGIVLGASALFGLYLAWLGGLAAIAIGVVAVARARGGGAGRWVLAAGLAAALAWPAVAPFRERLAGVGHRAGASVAREEPLWQLSPWRGADAAAFVTPGKVDAGGAYVREHPVYLGYATIALAALGAWHPAWLGVLACVVAAPGDTLSWEGRPIGGNPAIVAFRLLPFAERFNHHARLMLLGQLLLVGLAARGAARVGARRLGRWAAVGGAAALLAETAALSPARLPLPVAPTTSRSIYSALWCFPESLPVVVVGAAGPGIHPQRVFFDQRAHGRTLLHDPNRPAEGRPREGVVVVALGDAVARVAAVRGPPQVSTADGAAWGPATAVDRAVFDMQGCIEPGSLGE